MIYIKPVLSTLKVNVDTKGSKKPTKKTARSLVTYSLVPGNPPPVLWGMQLLPKLLAEAKNWESNGAILPGPVAISWSSQQI